MNTGSCWLLLALVLSAVVLLGSIGVVAGDSAPELRLGDGAGEDAEEAEEVVVRFTPAPPDADDVEDIRRHAEERQSPFLDHVEGREDVDVVKRFWISNSALVEVEGDAAEELVELDGVRELHPNYRYRVAQADPVRDEGPPREIGHVRRSHGYLVDYGVEAINATAVWNETRGDGVKVAVLDTGVEPSHPDVDLYSSDPTDSGRPGGWKEFDSQGAAVESEPYDAGVHGTHISGTVAGGDDSGIGIGVAPEADLVHAKVFDVGGTFTQINAGMQWAVEENVDVMSLSFGVECEDGSRYVQPMIEPLLNAEAAGTFVVAATGNGGEGCTSSPSNVPESLAVGAVDRFTQVPSFSSGGEVNTTEAWGDAARSNWSDSYVVPDVTAPGVEVVSAVPGGGYRQMDGTSMASPHVAGAAALVQSATEERLTPDELREALEGSTWKPDEAPTGKDVRYGEGVIDVYDAVEQSRPEDGEAAEGGTDGNETVGGDTNETVDGDGNETDDGSDEIPEELPGMGVAATVAALAGLLVLRRKR